MTCINAIIIVRFILSIAIGGLIGYTAARLSHKYKIHDVIALLSAWIVGLTVIHLLYLYGEYLKQMCVW